MQVAGAAGNAAGRGDPCAAAAGPAAGGRGGGQRRHRLRQNHAGMHFLNHFCVWRSAAAKRKRRRPQSVLQMAGCTIWSFAHLLLKHQVWDSPFPPAVNGPVIHVQAQQRHSAAAVAPPALAADGVRAAHNTGPPSGRLQLQLNM